MRARLSLIRARRSVRMRKSFWILAAPGRAGTRGRVGTLRAAEATHGELEGQSDAAPALKVATPFSSSSVAIEVLSSSLLPLSSSMHCQANAAHRVGALGAQGRHAAGAAHRNQFRVVVLQRRAGLVSHTRLLHSARVPCGTRLLDSTKTKMPRARVRSLDFTPLRPQTIQYSPDIHSTSSTCGEGQRKVRTRTSRHQTRVHTHSTNIGSTRFTPRVSSRGAGARW